MKEVGRVISLKNGLVQVEVARSDQCGRCGRCAHFSFSPTTLVVEAKPVGNVEIGDLVELELPDREFLALSFIVYVVPLLGTGVGALVGYGLGLLRGNPGLTAAVFAVLGLVASFGAVVFVDRKSRQRGRFLPLARQLVLPTDDSLGR